MSKYYKEELNNIIYCIFDLFDVKIVIIGGVIIKDYNQVSEEDIVVYVKRSKYRVKVLKSLENEILMPKEISIKTRIVINHISKVLSELKIINKLK